MVVKLADNIYSPLGATTWENYCAVMAGRCALRPYTLPDGARYTASLFPERERRSNLSFTFFEQLCIVSASDAIARAGIDPRAKDVWFFLSTTKGNVEMLRTSDAGNPRVLLGNSARLIASHFGNPNPPVVVSNACVSGLSAQIMAMRSLEEGICQTAVVIGCDVQCDFIISGFQCLHALSEDECRPFDIQRCGLNLGEAAATIIYSNQKKVGARQWVIERGAMCNDANHISGPSRTGEGSFRCLQSLGLTPEEKEHLAFVSVHGTSTMYNDEMESIALERAGLSATPIFSLKGIYGHTMGAAGVLESVLSMQAIEHGIVFGTRGFENKGVSGNVNICAENRTTDERAFVKLLSGFGGCNAAMYFEWVEKSRECLKTGTAGHNTIQTSLPAIKIMPSADELVELYRTHVGDYPKFFKMDPLSRLGFVASEMLLKLLPVCCTQSSAQYGVLLFNRSASLADDIAYQKTIEDKGNYYPSPSLFVYTLANIVAGEIAIRNHFQTETNFVVLDAPRTDVMSAQISIAAKREPLIAGWCEEDGQGHCQAILIAVPQHTSPKIIEIELNKLIK